jgi:hypothetical protein
MEILICLIMLQLKHLVVDWCWQPEYEWRNKGTYGHWGGVRHALKNAVGTCACFVPFVTAWPLLLWILVLDFMIHYHVDFGKMMINHHYAWSPTAHPQFWWLTGADQALHQLTYVLLIWISFF